MCHKDMLCPRTLNQMYFGAGTSERKKTLSCTSPDFKKSDLKDMIRCNIFLL